MSPANDAAEQPPLAEATKALEALGARKGFPPELQLGLQLVRVLSALALLERGGTKTDTTELSKQAETLRDALAATTEGRLVELRQRLDLRPIDEFALLIALSLEHDPLAAVTLTALLGEEPRYGLSPRLIALVARFSQSDGVRLALGREHPLVRSGVLEESGPDGVPATLRGYRLPHRVAAWLSGSDSLDSVLRTVGGEILPQLKDDDDEDDEERVAAATIVRRIVASDQAITLIIEGNGGTGRTQLASTSMRAVGRVAVKIDAAQLPDDRFGALRELRNLRLECWLRRAIPVIAGIDAWRGPADVFGDLLTASFGPTSYTGTIVLTGSIGANAPDLGRRILRVSLNPTTTRARTIAWSKALSGPKVDPALVADIPNLAAQYVLGRAAIRRVAANARLLSDSDALDAASIKAGLAAELQTHFSGLALRLPVTQEWTDLVLPLDTRDDVMAFVSRTHHAAQVYDQWGFRDKLGRGLGLSALFSGPPGTGKTMVAGLIAKQLGLELYVVDLSQIVSKWVGETEKHLGRVFDGAAAGNVLLLFDEADSLFAQRTEVKSSNDRYANLEVNYLLTKLEQFSGVVILTTNLQGSVDPAVARRMAAHVRFYPPEEQERVALWQRLIPKSAPIGELNFDELASRYTEMAGGHIRNAVLRAAFLAAQEGTVIQQEVLHRAAMAEYRGMGKML